MNITSATSSTIKLNLPAGILANARTESERIGISVQDFVRMLLATYFAHAPSIKAISKEQTLYQEALDDLNNGRYHTVESAKELNIYFDSLD